jgi:hypothetical protein
MAIPKMCMYIEEDLLELESYCDDNGNVRIIMPSKFEILEHLYNTYYWVDRIPNVQIRYVPKNAKLKPGMQCIMSSDDFSKLTNSSFVLECPDLLYAKKTINAKLFRSLSFLGISTPEEYTLGIRNRSVRYHYNKGYLLIWSFDDNAYVLTRMLDISSLIQPMDLDDCVNDDPDFANYLKGRGVDF